MAKRIYIGQYIDEEFGLIYGGKIGEETIVIHTERKNNIGAGYDYVLTTTPLYYPSREDMSVSITQASLLESKKLTIRIKQIDFYTGSILVETHKS